MTLVKTAMKDEKQESGVPALETVNLTKRYSGRTHKLGLSARGFVRSFVVGEEWETLALNKVSLSVKRGEIFGLLGPNGSGKTTLIKILSNLVIPDSGSAYVEGISVAKRPYETAARLQTVLSESIGLEKRITARQNLSLFASLYSLPKAEAEERIGKLIEYFSLGDVADKTSQSLSTGTARRLSVCRVLLSNASVIVFDEPTSGLDPYAADSFRRLIVRDLVNREKKTILMATHNLSEATSMCDRIALLSHGRVLAVGTPDEIRRSVGDLVHMDITLDANGGSLDELRSGLSGLEGVNAVEIANSHDGVRVRLRGKKDLNYLGVLTLISSRGFRVLSLETSPPSLEDAFFRLTQQAE